MAVKLVKEEKDLEREYAVAFNISVNGINNMELEEKIEKVMANIGEITSVIEVERINE